MVQLHHSILNQPYKLTTDQIEFYRANQFIKLRNVFDEELLQHYSKIISKKVQELNSQHLPLGERSTYDKAFLQIMNIWTHDEKVKRFVFNRRLAQIATELMGVTGVRMYHDQALFKEPGGGFTPWHADQYYWPLSNDKTITAWIPMQDTELEMGPLEFSAKSYMLQGGRDLAISDDSESVISEKLRLGDFKQEFQPFEIGEVSFHSGWLFHRAGPNKTDHMRQVMTVIYIDKGMRLSAPVNKNQVDDWEEWCPGVKIGEVIDSPLNPILYSSTE